MSTPEWKKFEESGGDILDTSILMLSDLQYAPLPLTGGKLQITDGSTLPVGAVSGFPVAASETVAAVLGPLTDRITEYANSEIGSKPYLPRTEELCIAKCEPYTQWFRAVLCELTNGPGSETAEVLYLDYGNLSRVPTSSLRKCLRDFIELPAVAVQAYIAGQSHSACAV
ncbi:tudor domain-containing protein 1 [Plutella xylostella]|uniref:tudor domain-containing protein 1 n=1 Tax=Plutella xylostella TaxID=51655 RepID=UPI002032C928|nr:tudor domain-containing protein 1 [Plutella xylostella]